MQTGQIPETLKKKGGVDIKMPYSCVRPYDRDTASVAERVRSCVKTAIGPYSGLQPCVSECFTDGPGRKKSIHSAATRLQNSFKSRQLRHALHQRLKDARQTLSQKKVKHTKMVRKSPTKSRGKKKTGCPAKSKTNCTSPCKWASGPRRSFCRSAKNKRK